MKTILLGLMLLGFAGAALGVEPSELDNRIKMLTAKLEALQRKPDKRIPADIMQKARGIILLDRTKAGLVFGYQGGSGVALMRDAKSDKWSPVAFVSTGEASLGLQIGGEQGFYAIVLMNTNAAGMLTNPSFAFGGEARGTAGNLVGEAEASTLPPVLIYADRKGLYGGAVIKGGSFSADDKANQVYYGTYESTRDILFEHKVQPGEPASYLAQRLNWFSQPHDDSKSIWN